MIHRNLPPTKNLHDNIVDTNNERLNNLESSFEKWKEKEFPTQFIFVNKSLNMNSGKAAALGLLFPDRIGALSFLTRFDYK